MLLSFQIHLSYHNSVADAPLLPQPFGQELRVGRVDTTDRSQGFALPQNLIYTESGYQSW
jgi:hypothetical protein